MRSELSKDEARRVVLHVQGLTRPRPSRPGSAHLRKLAARLHAFQIDSVNVLARAHYVPAFSRLGAYSTDALDKLAYGRRELFEYWGHAASLMPVELHPLLRWRMEGNARSETWLSVPQKERAFVEDVYTEVSDHGPLAARDLSDGGKARGPWWGWSRGKRALEFLVATGRLAVYGRRNFERIYDVTERVLPPGVMATPTPSPDEAKRELLMLAARALGVATAADLADYFHLDTAYERKRTGSPPVVGRLVEELVADGRLVELRVEGWKQPAYAVPGLRIPLSVETRALVSPFDPLVWERKRTKRVFDFDYTIEIYVPAPKRKFGYYVLPFLLDDRLVARVDLKADRKAKTLRVPSAFVEDGEKPSLVAAELARELQGLAGWLGLERVSVGRRGDLARDLSRAVGASSGR